ncbi:MAG TPA: hypothetical protein VGF69_01205 [Thermoanaerobaculia bacterium]|jgi:hypothetical protein
MANRLLPIALFALLTLSAVAPIRSYDLGWHLATGWWIVDHQALPATDPFGVASDRKPWINGEWLFEVPLPLALSVVGFEGFSVLRALFIGGLFTLIYLRIRRAQEPHVALLLVAIGFAGGAAMIDVRPSAAAALFVAVALSMPKHRYAWIGYAVLTAVWINVHPSALIAPAIALLMTRGAVAPVASALALLVNPYGVKGILAPLELTLFASSGDFVNAEWLPSSPMLFPLLYIAVVLGFLALVREKDVFRIVLFAMFAYLAMRHVRNQNLFFVAFPLLMPPVRVPRRVAYAAAAAAIAFIAITTDHRLGLPPERFPLEAVARLRESRLMGNIYNPDQFGGYLIWSFYPARRVLTDGRNELYHTYIPEYAKARLDSRAWQALLRKYRIDLAVDEYRPPMSVVDARTGRQTEMDASLAYWPRKDWALLARDEAGMVFARRAAFTAEEIARWELR